MPVPVATDPASLVAIDRYPVNDLDAAAPVIAAAREALTERGVAILPGFVRSEALEVMVDEADELAQLGNHQDVEGSPYLGLPDESYPVGHPKRFGSRSALTAVAYDLFPAESLLRALYEWDALMAFVGALLDRAPLYRYADPFGALNQASMFSGDELGWHFDQTDFVVSIALQSSEEGGDFENVALLRAPDDERYDDVAAVLTGAAPERVETLPMVPGTLMVFEGRRSLHRVTPIVGDCARHVALLAYDTEPGTDSTDLLKLVRYGRLPETSP